MDAAALTEVRTPAVAVAGVLDRLQASSEPLECVTVGAGVQGRAGLVVVATSAGNPWSSIGNCELMRREHCLIVQQSRRMRRCGFSR